MFYCTIKIHFSAIVKRQKNILFLFSYILGKIKLFYPYKYKIRLFSD